VISRREIITAAATSHNRPPRLASITDTFFPADIPNEVIAKRKHIISRLSRFRLIVFAKGADRCLINIDQVIHQTSGSQDFDECACRACIVPRKFPPQVIAGTESISILTSASLFFQSDLSLRFLFALHSTVPRCFKNQIHHVERVHMRVSGFSNY